MPFSDYTLDDRLLRALAEQGVDEPTAVQAAVLPLALAGGDVLASAATGSGKTLAYLLPALQRLLARPGRNALGALILSPTRELAKQINKTFGELARYTSLRSTLLTGGADLAYQASVLRKLPDLVVATPGRLLEHIERRNIDFADLQLLVLDEADRVLEMGFGNDVITIAGHCPRERQTLLFSATLNHKGLAPVRDVLLREPQTVQMDPPRQVNADIRQQVILSDDMTHKLRQLEWLLAHEASERTLVFANTREQVDAINNHLLPRQIPTAALHSERSQDDRAKTLARFRNGRLRVLVATDVAARGLDIEGLDLVVNFSVPRSGDDYIHRVGRTGRAGSEGLAITFVNAGEWNLMASIERYLKQQAERREIPGLRASFQGPKKVKTSGKAATTGKRKKDDTKPEAPKKKERLRDRKQIGKRRQPVQGGAEPRPAADSTAAGGPAKSGPAKGGPAKSAAAKAAPPPRRAAPTATEPAERPARREPPPAAVKPRPDASSAKQVWDKALEGGFAPLKKKKPRD